MPKPVLTKADFVRRYEAGEFGNAAPTWLTFGGWAESGYEGQMHIRNRITGGPTYYDIHPYGVGSAWNKLTRKQKIPESSLYLSAMAPTSLTAIQGEVIRYSLGLDLRYTRRRVPMREALRKEQHRVTGIVAKIILEHELCSKSYDWMTYLLEAYPEHVIEFSTYGRCWGTLPGYNTVFWEVRKY